MGVGDAGVDSGPFRALDGGVVEGHCEKEVSYRQVRQWRLSALSGGDGSWYSVAPLYVNAKRLA